MISLHHSILNCAWQEHYRSRSLQLCQKAHFRCYCSFNLSYCSFNLSYNLLQRRFFFGTEMIQLKSAR